MGGRRPQTVAGAEREQAILKALRLGCTRRASAAAADVSEDTLARMLKDAVFADAVKRAEGSAEATYTAIVADAAPKSWQAAAWWLERRRHEDYARRERVDMTVDIRKTIERLTDDPTEREAAFAEVDRILAGER